MIRRRTRFLWILLTAAVVPGAIFPTLLSAQSGSAAAGPGSAAADSSDAWLPAAAAAESIGSYWRKQDEAWMKSIPPELLEVDLPPAVVDSLSALGDQKVSDLIGGRIWRTSFRPFGRLWFNRVEGFRLGVTGRVYQVGPARPELELGVGYGFSSSDWIYDGTLSLPLLKKRRRLPDGTPVGMPWALWEVVVSGGRYVQRFGGDDRWVRSYTAFTYGADPNQYFESRRGRADLRLRPWRWLTLQAGVLVDEQRPLSVATTWNLFGQRNNVEDNLQAVPLRSEAATVGLGLTWRRWRLWAEAERHRLEDSPLLESYADAAGPPEHLTYGRARAGLSGNLLDRHGNEYLLKVQAESWNRQVPLQWKTFLGDYRTLRGYPARTLAGEVAAWASLDVRFGFDLFRAMRFPVLKKWGLQPIALFDWGWANALAGPQLHPWATGWRADAGFGFGKLLGVPGYKGNVRLYVAHPVGNGQGDEPWRVLLVFEDY